MSGYCRTSILLVYHFPGLENDFSGLADPSEDLTNKRAQKQ